MRDPVRRAGDAALLAVLLLAPAVADACRCLPRTPAVLARAADAIVIADVAGIDDHDPAARIYRLRALGSWKTRLAGPVIVRSEATTCRARLAPGQRYLVYLKRVGHHYWTDACSGNVPAVRATAAVAMLGKAFGGR